VESISALTEERVGLFLGKERSWMIQNLFDDSDYGTVPRGDVQKGPINFSR
jgi:hypothetical protein